MNENVFEEFRLDPRTQKLEHAHITSLHQAILVRRGKIIAQATNKIGSRSKGVLF